MYLKKEETIQDALQEVYIKAASHLKTIKDPAMAKAWFRTVTRNTCLNLLRKKTETLLDEDKEFIMNNRSDNDIAVQPEMAFDKKEKSSIVMDLVASLPLEQKETVLYYYIHQLPIKRVAELCECSIGTVKSRLNYARKKLQGLIIEQEQKMGMKLRGVAFLPMGFLLRSAAEKFPLSSAMAEKTLLEIQTAASITSPATSVSTTAAAAVATKTTIAYFAATVGAKALVATIVIVVGAVSIIAGVMFSLNTEETLPVSSSPKPDVSAPAAPDVAGPQVTATPMPRPDISNEPLPQAINMSPELTEQYVDNVVKHLAFFLVENPGTYTAQEFLTADNANSFLISGPTQDFLLDGTFRQEAPQQEDWYRQVLIPKEDILKMFSDMFGQDAALLLESSEFGTQMSETYGRAGLFEGDFYPFFFSDAAMIVVMDDKAYAPISTDSDSELEFLYDISYAGGPDESNNVIFVKVIAAPESKYGCIITEFGTRK